MKAGYLSWLGLLGAGIVAGIYTAARLFSEGHVLFNANDVVLWTLPIGSYVFFALISSGLGLLSALPLLFGVGRYMIEAKRIVLLAIATLLAAFVSIGLELGSLEHVHYLFLSPNMSSPIQIMGLIYSAELVFLVLKFWRIHKDDLDSGLSKVCGVGSFVCALFGPLVLGSIFGITEARPTFFGSFLPVLCLLIAIVSGLAGFVLYDSIYLLLVKTASSRAGEGTILDDASLKLCFTLFLALLFYALWGAYRSATTLPDFAAELNFSLALVLVVPFVLLLFKGVRASSWGRILASAIALVAFFGLHMSVILAGQVRPMGPKAEGLPGVLSYSPSLWEILVVVMSLAVLLLAATLAERYLDLTPEPA